MKRLKYYEELAVEALEATTKPSLSITEIYDYLSERYPSLRFSVDQCKVMVWRALKDSDQVKEINPWINAHASSIELSTWALKKPKTKFVNKTTYLVEPGAGPACEPLHKSYVELIYEALSRSPSRRLSLSEIYQYMESNYSYFRTPYLEWKGSVRHALSKSKFFVNCSRRPSDGTHKTTSIITSDDYLHCSTKRKKGEWAIKDGLDESWLISQFDKRRRIKLTAIYRDKVQVLGGKIQKDRNGSTSTKFQNTCFRSPYYIMPPVSSPEAQSSPSSTSNESCPASEGDESSEQIEHHELYKDGVMLLSLANSFKSST